MAIPGCRVKRLRLHCQPHTAVGFALMPGGESDNMTGSRIRRVWAGEERLAVVFWWYYVACPSLMGMLLGGIVPFITPSIPSNVGPWLLATVLTPYSYGPRSVCGAARSTRTGACGDTPHAPW